MNRWAVFDIDGTILPDVSLERRFIRHLKEISVLRPHHYLPYLLNFLVHIRHLADTAYLKSNKMYYRNLPANLIFEMADKYVGQQILPDLSAKGVARIKLYQSEKVNILLLSGSPDFLVKPLAEALGVTHHIGCPLEIINGHFTGRLSGPHPYGIRKTTLLRQLHKKKPINFDESIVFANHHSDYDHMKLFGRAVAVNPTPRLRLLAKKQNWPVNYW